MSAFLQYLLSGIAQGAGFALVALGYVAIYRVTHVVNFAQGSFVLMGGYATSTLLALALPGPVAALVAMLIVAPIGALIGALALGNGQLPIIASLMITLGLSVLVEGTILFIYGDIPTTYNGVGSTAVNVFGALVLPQQVVVLAAAAVVFPLFQLFFNRTYIGKAVTACALNARAASLVGIDPRRMALFAFAVSAALGALAGAITTPLAPLTSDAGVNIAVNGFAGAIVGGLVNPAGAVIGSLLLGVAQTMMAGYFDPSYQFVVALVVMIAVLVARPNGLFAASQSKRTAKTPRRQANIEGEKTV